MLRWLASLVIVLLLALDVALPATSLGRRGHEAQARVDAPGAFAVTGVPLPELDLRDLSGREVEIADFRGHPLLITFERSVDW